MPLDKDKHSPITRVLERIFFHLEYISPATLFCGTRVHGQKGASETQLKLNARQQARTRDCYYVVWCGIDALCFAVVGLEALRDSPIPKIAACVAGFHILELFQATINFHLFDALRLAPAPQRVATLARVMLLSVWNFFELILLFGIIYASPFGTLNMPMTAWDGLYFSAITQFTIGYGDILPLGWTRAIVGAQTSVGFVFALFALSRMIAFLPPLLPILDGSETNASPKEVPLQVEDRNC